jgi:hypothetical protein
MRPDKERAHDWAITPGDYQIVQFPETPDEMSIEGNLSVYVASGSLNPVYLRLIKEKRSGHFRTGIVALVGFLLPSPKKFRIIDTYD